MSTKHKDSHLDHSLTTEQVAYVLALEAPEGEVRVQTVELPDELGTVPCALYGPVMGDGPIPEKDCFYEQRGDRAGKSRMVRTVRVPTDNPTPAQDGCVTTKAPRRQTRKVTVITGPHDGDSCVLFTAFGGPQAPREPWEFEQSPDFKSFDQTASEAFWKKHALAH